MQPGSAVWEGCHASQCGGVWRHGCVPSPEFVFIFELKMVRFGAFWVLFFLSAACFTRKITAEFDEGSGISASLVEHSA